MVLRCSGSALRFEGPMLASGRRTGLLLFGLLSNMLKGERKKTSYEPSEYWHPKHYCFTPVHLFLPHA